MDIAQFARKASLDQFVELKNTGLRFIAELEQQIASEQERIKSYEEAIVKLTNEAAC